VSDQQRLPVVDGKGLVFVARDVAARAERCDLVPELRRHELLACAPPERRAAEAIEQVMCGLKVPDALERRADVLVVLAALDLIVDLHREQVQ
jgi:hypothetical protein